MRRDGSRFGRAGTSLVEMLMVMTLGGLITAAAVSAIAPTNELARSATDATEYADGARSTVHFLASHLRRVPGGGVLVATVDSIVVAMPIAVGVFCANESGNFTAYFGLGGAELDIAAIDGYALRNTAGVWTYTTQTGTSLFSGAVQGRNPCVTAGGGQAGSDSDYYTLGPNASYQLGSAMLLWDKQTYRFGASVLDPTTRGFLYGPTGGSQVEIAYALHPDSGFRYRLTGTTTWVSAVEPASVASIDAIRVMSGAADGTATDLERDIPLMNTQ